MMIDFDFLSSPEETLAALEEFLSCFPHLLERVTDLNEYAGKLAKYGRILVLNEDGKKVGLCCFYSNDHASFTGYISLIGVKSEFRGKGYGSSLIERTIKECISSGMRKIKLEVRSDNTAIEFYKKTGFCITEKASQECYYMEKDI